MAVWFREGERRGRSERVATGAYRGPEMEINIMSKLTPIPMVSLAALLSWGTANQAWAYDRDVPLPNISPRAIIEYHASNVGSDTSREDTCDSDVGPDQAVRIKLADKDHDQGDRDRSGPEVTRSNPA